MTKKLFVGGLSWGTGDAQFKAAFEKFGSIAEAKVILDQETGRSRGFGFVTFSDDAAADRAIQEMDGSDLDGRVIRVNEAQERAPRPRDRGAPGGPRDRGAPGNSRDRGAPGMSRDRGAPGDQRDARPRDRSREGREGREGRPSFRNEDRPARGKKGRGGRGPEGRGADDRFARRRNLGRRRDDDFGDDPGFDSFDD